MAPSWTLAAGQIPDQAQLQPFYVWELCPGLDLQHQPAPESLAKLKIYTVVGTGFEPTSDWIFLQMVVFMYNCLGQFTVETLLNDVIHHVDVYITLNDVVHHGHGVFPPTLHDSVLCLRNSTTLSSSFFVKLMARLDCDGMLNELCRELKTLLRIWFNMADVLLQKHWNLLVCGMF